MKKSITKIQKKKLQQNDHKKKKQKYETDENRNVAKKDTGNSDTRENKIHKRQKRRYKRTKEEGREK